MGTLGRSTRNGRQSASRRAAPGENPYKVKYAAALRELREAAEQQAATAEVLRIVSSSARDPQAVFDVILKSAMRLCDAHLGLINEWNGPAYRTVAQRGAKGAFAKWLFDRGEVRPPSYSTPMRMMQAKRPVQFDDLGKSQAYRRGSPAAVRFVDDAGVRTYLAVPLLRKGEVIGAIVLYRVEVRPFTPRQIALVKTFADQAVIAVENARLFNETTTALARQTATAEILRVLGGSMTDAQPVFDAIVKNCHELFKECGVVLRLAANGELHPVATIGATPGPVPIDRKSAIGTCVLDGRTVHIPDLEAAAKRLPRVRQLGLKYGYRSGMYAPLMHKGRAIGAIGVLRRQPGAFDEKDVQLLNTFADQAVIAIENVRLFNETKEALEQQTATAEILKVIAGSPTEVQPVFDVIVERAVRLCGARFGRVYRFDGSTIHMVASHGLSMKGLGEVQRVFPRAVADDTIVGRVILTRQPYFIEDIERDQTVPSLSRKMIEALGTHRQLTIPMLRAGEPIGAITLGWEKPAAFDPQEAALLQTFADQAVIAIENVRLFNETKEALDHQQASADILRIVSQSVADSQPAFEAILAAVRRLFAGFDATVWLLEQDRLVAVAVARDGPTIGTAGHSVPATPDHAYGIAVRERRPVQIDDVAASRDITELTRQDLRSRNRGAVLLVPFVQDSGCVGAISVSRSEPYKFSEKQVALLKNFAAQAVIAIENARLFNETREALERQTAISDILRVISGSPADIRPVLDTVAAHAARICHAQIVDIALAEGPLLRMVASVGDAGQVLGQELPLDRSTVSARSIVDRAPVHVIDVQQAENEFPLGSELARKYDIRTILAVPLLREGRALGSIMARRGEVRRFEDQDVALLKTFADQAAIAIENARLFNETKEALERQTATAEILKVISGSPTDVQPVFDAIARSAVILCSGMFGAVFRYDGEQAHFAAHYGFSEEARELMQRRYPRVPQGLIAPTIFEGVVSHSPDTLSDSRAANPELHRALGVRGFLGVPMLLEGRPIGCICVFRREPGPFADAEIAVLQTFADQAVIAIENVRLFNETKEALERQTATAEILKVISGSPTNTQPVFQAIAERAARICDAGDARIHLVDGTNLRLVAGFGDVPAPDIGTLRSLEPGLAIGRAVIEGRPVHVDDVQAVPEEFPTASKYGAQFGWRTVLAVPLMREQRALGAISLRRPEVRPFDDKQIALLKTFADQAAIAIENVRLFNETKEALERQTATAEILKVIAGSPSDTQPVFDAIVKSAVPLFQGVGVSLRLVRGERIETVAFAAGPDCGQTEEFTNSPFDDRSVSGRAVMRREVIDVRDVFAEEWVSEDSRKIAERMGWRAVAAAALLRENEALGTLVVTRAKPTPFSQKEITLLRTFADQAVIAIENVRLFNETREALERQTATAEILKVISASPTDVQPVFDAIAERAAVLCGAKIGVVTKFDGELLHLVAFYGASPDLVEPIRAGYPVRPGGDTVTARAVRDCAPAQIPDLLADPDYVPKQQSLRAGYRSNVAVPLLREGKVIGALSVARAETGVFSEKEVGLLQTFADQAVIAIENVRLFNETKEALEQQTATAEILKVISSTPTDTQPVFDAIASSALRIFGGMDVSVGLVDGDAVHIRAGTLGSLGRGSPRIPLTRDSCAGRAALDCAEFNIADIEEPGTPAVTRERGLQNGWRSIALVPMLREGRSIGHISVHRERAAALDDKQFALLKTFANQAVIAIENTRLFNELEARTQALTRSVRQLMALGEVGQAIGSTLELETVLKTIVTHAVKLSGVHAGIIYEYHETRNAFDLRASEGFDEESLAGLREAPIRVGVGAVGRAVATRTPTAVPDTHVPEYPRRFRALLDRQGFRAVLAVPLTREERTIGALLVVRKSPGAFAPEIVELLGTLATQSALAIQNARLYREIEEKSRELETASRHKSQFLASMSHELRTPLNAILGFNEMILDQVYGEVPPDVMAPLENIQSSGKHLLRLINNVLDLAKIEAGRMELALCDFSVQDTVASVHSTLQPLAAEKGLEFVAEVPADLPIAHGDPGRLAQCLMNLAGNSLKFTKQGRVAIGVARDNGVLRFSVADTGIGIPPDKIESLFTEFKQTDATVASEYGGTGLGLSITKKFIEMHGGKIWVESEPGKGSTFRFEIPLRAAQ